MAYGNQGDFQRKMYQGNWKCSQCGADITELPFEPKNVDNLKCKDCFRSDRGSSDRGSFRDRGSRSFGSGQTYEGNWKCSKCQADITSLPFDPDPSRVDQLLCRECHRERKQSFGGGRGFGRR